MANPLGPRARDRQNFVHTFEHAGGEGARLGRAQAAFEFVEGDQDPHNPSLGARTGTEKTETTATLLRRTLLHELNPVRGARAHPRK